MEMFSGHDDDDELIHRTSSTPRGARQLECLRCSAHLVVSSRFCGNRRFRQSRVLMRRMYHQTYKSRSRKLVVNRDVVFTLLVACALVVFACEPCWWPWYHACRVGEAGVPGPHGIHTKHLKCEHCATWLSSTSALRAHIRRFHTVESGMAPHQGDEDSAGVGETRDIEAVPVPSFVATPGGGSGDSTCDDDDLEWSHSDPDDEDSFYSSRLPDCGNSCVSPFRSDITQASSVLVVTTNVTSLRQQFDEVLRIPWHVACLQEVRLTSAGQFDMRQQLQEAGCSVVFGKPQEELTNPWHCKQGGVAIVTRNGLTLQSVKPVCEVETRLFETRRFVHAAFGIGNGSRVAHVFCVYGFSGANNCTRRMAMNEQLLSDTFHVAAGLGEVPVVLAGDFNVTPDISSALQRSMSTGRWCDTADMCAKARGVDPDPTCFIRSPSVGSCIDAIFCNNVFRTALGESGVFADSTLPTHRPVMAEMRIGDCCRQVLTCSKPRRVPLDFLDPDKDAEAAISDRACRDVLASFRLFLERSV